MFVPSVRKICQFRYPIILRRNEMKIIDLWIFVSFDSSFSNTREGISSCFFPLKCGEKWKWKKRSLFVEFCVFQIVLHQFPWWIWKKSQGWLPLRSKSFNLLSKSRGIYLYYVFSFEKAQNKDYLTIFIYLLLWRTQKDSPDARNIFITYDAFSLRKKRVNIVYKFLSNFLLFLCTCFFDEREGIYGI